MGSLILAGRVKNMWAPTCHHGPHSSPRQCQLLEQLLSELEGDKQGCLLSDVLPRRTRKGGERTSSEDRIREVNNVRKGNLRVE